MNKQTKANRKIGKQTKVIKGTGSFEWKDLEIFKGRPCVTDFAKKTSNPMNKRKSPWRGAKV